MNICINNLTLLVESMEHVAILNDIYDTKCMSCYMWFPLLVVEFSYYI